MRIISKYKDYYDGVQSLGQDSSMMYMRKTVSLDVPTEQDIDKFLFDKIHDSRIIRIGKKNSLKNNLYICKAIIGFCGQLISCACVHWHLEDQLESPLFFFF